MFIQSTVVSLLSVALVFSSVEAKTSTQAAAAVTFIPGRFIVSLEPTTNNGLDKRGLVANVIDSIQASGIPALATKTLQADNLFNGASIKVPVNTTAADLLAVPGVKQVWPVRVVRRPEGVVAKDGVGASSGTGALKPSPYGLNPPRNAYKNDQWTPHTMTGVDKMHDQGFLGAGITVCILDSGVDYKNPILGGGFGPGYKIKQGYTFVGDDNGSMATPNDPYTSCSDHGTHVSGIVGANANAYGFTGVAPEASLGMYRVFPCTGSTGDDVIMQGLLRASTDGCDVINMSLGGSIGWLDGSPVQALVDKLNGQGILTVTSAGNEGSEGLFFTSSPAATLNGTGVASVDVTALPAYNMTFRTRGLPQLPYLSAAPLTPPRTLTVYFTSANGTDPNGDACFELPSSTPDLTNRLVVIERGACLFTTKLSNAAAKGAKYVMIYNSATGSSLPYIDASEGVTAVAGLRRQDGLTLLKYYQANKNNLQVTFPADSKLVPGVLDTVSGGQVSDFSTFGPTNEMFGVPSFGAPGGNILSTFPLALGGIGVLSGTSMSCPFVSGSAALILSARKDRNFTPLQIRNLFTSTANPIPVKRLTTSPLETTASQGGGLIQVYRAYQATSFVNTYQLNLNDTAFFNGTQTISITNKNTKTVTYRYEGTAAQIRAVYDENARAAVLPSLAPPAISGTSTVTFRPGRVTIPAGQTATFQVKVTQPRFSSGNLARFPIYSGFVSITADDSLRQKFQVPFMGLAAKMLDMPIVDTTSTYATNELDGLKYPYLVSGDGSSFQLNPSNVATYSASSGVVLTFRLAQATHAYNVDLVSADTRFRATISTSNNANLKRRSDIPAFGGELELLERSTDVSGHAQLVTRAAQQYSDTKVLGRVQTSLEVARDYAVDSGVGLGYTTQTVAFTGQYEPSLNNGVYATATNDTPYRLLLRALKTTGDPALESSWESWLSPPFKLSS